LSYYIKVGHVKIISLHVVTCSGCECSGILHSECGGTWWRTGGEVKGKLANGVGSQYSHTTTGRSVPSITNADAHTSAATSRLKWLHRRFKWTRPFRRKTKTGFCACANRFRTSSTISCIKAMAERKEICIFHQQRVFGT